MTKYKWSLLGLIISVILFISLLISPLITFINEAIIPAEPVPAEFQIPPIDVFIKGNEEASKASKEWYENRENWYENVPKKLSQHALSEFGKSFYHWNLFWIPIIVFSFMIFNYKNNRKGDEIN